MNEQLPMFGKTSTRKPKQPSGDHQELVAEWFQRHRQRYGRDPIAPERSMRALREVLKLVGLPQAKRVLKRYYEDDDAFVVRQRHAPWYLVPRIEYYLEAQPRSAASSLVKSRPTEAEAAALMQDISEV